MTPEQEINRIKREYKDYWPRLEAHSEIQAALAAKNPIKLGEWAAKLVYGNTLSKEDLEAGQADVEHYENLKRREKMIEQQKKKSPSQSMTADSLARPIRWPHRHRLRTVATATLALANPGPPRPFCHSAHPTRN